MIYKTLEAQAAYYDTDYDDDGCILLVYEETGRVGWAIENIIARGPGAGY